MTDLDSSRLQRPKTFLLVLLHYQSMVSDALCEGWAFNLDR
jgi:hypothetical protein